ncbi:RNase H family protein [Georgenia sp. SUBG003]|uniref:RNase H family protein n=1 Tax=Georgenia sp. SUBG003 TaxID=1497974 RepID=UPI0006935A93
METWANQDELGRQLGIDAQSVGDLLVAAGLKVGRQATDDALDRGLAEPDVSPLGRPFVRWRAEEVLPLLEPLAEQLKASPARREPESAPRRRPASKQAAPKPSVQVPGTTFDVVVALHAYAAPSPGPTGWAYVNQETRETTSGGLPDATDREGELVAALHLLDHLAPDAHLLVRSSSEPLVKTATVWAPTWRRNGWKKRDGQEPPHVDLVKELFAKIEARKGRTRFGLGASDDELILAAAQAAVVAARETPL